MKKTLVLLLALTMLLLTGCLDVYTEISLSELQYVADQADAEAYGMAVFGIAMGEDEDEESINLMIEELFGETDEVSHIHKNGRDFIGFEMPVFILNPAGLDSDLEIEELTIFAANELVDGKEVINISLWMGEVEEDVEEMGDDETPFNFTIMLTNDLSQKVTLFVNSGYLNQAPFTGDVVLQAGEQVELSFLDLFNDELYQEGTRLLALVRK